jgi:hypothetical protein
MPATKRFAGMACSYGFYSKNRLTGRRENSRCQIFPSEARYLSASSAAMQPVAALVQAWR